MNYREISPEELQGNPFTLIGSDWMLITAGDESGCNTMTASWGGLGVLWNKNVATVYIRPQRYTKEFVDKSERFTLTFFPEAYREALKICGTLSGRDLDKIKKAGLTPYYLDGTTAFEEAGMILVCRKLYQSRLQEENFHDKSCCEKNYPQKDYHDVYIAEIEKVLISASFSNIR
ncbi:MAG: flavin reductase [Lachnospiraceae bacterium]|nr:flavin reductase [Lachnospiraceae bacterium]